MRPRIAVSLLALGLGLALGKSPALAGDGDQPARRFDVGTLTRLRSDAEGPTLGAPAPETLMDARPEVRSIPFLEPGDLVDLVRTFVEPGSWEEGASLEVVGRWLEVRHRPEVLERVASFLAGLEAEARRGLTLAIEVREGPASAWPSAGDGASLLESGSLTVPFGVTGSLRDTNRVTFVADYTVEIAQGSTIANPIVQTAEQGLVVDAVAHPLADGRRALLEILLQRAAYGPSRLAQTGIDEEYLAEPYRSSERKGNGRIELPVYDHLQAHVTTVVEASGTFSVPFLLRDRVVELRGRVVGLSPPAPGIPLLPVGALGSRPWSVGFALPEVDPEEQTLVAPRLRRLGGRPESPAGDPDYLVEAIRRSVDPRTWEEMAGNLALGAGERLVVQASDDVREKVRAYLGEREVEALRPVEIELRVLSVPSVPAVGPGAAVPREQARRVAGGRLVTLLGRAASLLGGSTANFVADYYVTVAQEARIAAPVIGQSFDGIVANLTPRLAADGSTVAVELQLLRSRRKIAEEPFDTGTRYLGPIDRVTTDRALVDGVLEVPSGGTHVVDLGGDPDDPERRMALELAATLR